jgi:hypothetical protein
MNMAEQTLKSDLKKVIRKEIKDLEKTIKDTKASSEILETMKFNDAQYRTDIKSYWKREKAGHKKTRHKGTLKETIEKAEREFAGKYNFECNISDINAGYIHIDYNVSIQIGDRFFKVPEECWQKYKRLLK